MIAYLGTHCFVQTDNDDQARDLLARWKVPNPARAEAERRGFAYRHLPEYIYAGTLHRARKGVVVLPRGLAGELRPVVWVHKKTHAPCRYEAPTRSLRPYQSDAIKQVGDAPQGVIVAPCGAGKTEMALHLIASRGQVAVVIVPTRDLVQQWNERAKAVLGKHGAEQVHVMTASAAAGAKGRAPKPMPDHGLLLMDECHRLGAPTWAAICSRSAAAFRYGVTATPDRADGLGVLLNWHIGPILARVDSDELEACGAIVKPTYRVLTTGFKPEPKLTRQGTLDHGDLIGQLAADRARTCLVMSEAGNAIWEGKNVLVLTSRVDHAVEIGTDLGCYVLTGRVSAKKRADALESMRHEQGACIVATQLADEGLDLPSLDVLILAVPGKSERQTVQRAGRIMRPSPGKGTPEIIDVVDDHGWCWGAQRKRREALEGIVREA